jgi:hypothetical protein
MLRIGVAVFALAALDLTFADPAAARRFCSIACLEAQAKQRQEEAAEAAAYQKMLKERKEHETTTEYCYYVKGKLECKPAP